MSDQRVWQVLNEQIREGKAVIVKIDNEDYVQFDDEDVPILISDLAYNSELGLYQKSKFPEQQN